MGVDLADELARIDEFRGDWEGRGMSVDGIECKVASPGQVLAVSEQVPANFRRHFEVPIEGPYAKLLGAVRRVGAFAKVRTGGTTPELFPAAEQLTAFLLSATHHRVAFKATAGLHHPIRGEFPFTYAPEAARHVMYGFVNLLLATAELARGGEGETAQAILEDGDPGHFARDQHGIRGAISAIRPRNWSRLAPSIFLASVPAPSASRSTNSSARVPHEQSRSVA